MFDSDVAALYEVSAKELNLAVKRNIKRFPSDFMFQLTKEEFEPVRNQVENVEKGDTLKPQTITVQPGKGKYRKPLPYVFTEQGVAMLSSILKSDRAISMNLSIMRTSVEVGRKLLMQEDILGYLPEIKKSVGEQSAQLTQIYQALENLLDAKAAQRKWEDRERIGFRK